MQYKTNWTKQSEIERKWYLVDLDGKILGRAATKIANLLSGKGKVNAVANLDCGDYVVVINSKKVKVTNHKELEKYYYSHSGYPGGFKQVRYDEMQAKKPDFIIWHAVNNMLPNNKLRDRKLTRLFIYPGTEYKQVAQKPIEVKI